MNKEQVKGAVKDVAGKAQQEIGKLTGSEKQQIKGVANQAEGKIEKGVGNVKEAIEDADKGKTP
ncbi:MAG TPA: CsbD family protein [Burkholderiales bacterium]|jgi:uncharacterized protein YjbJ (UPF0337 family)|nr:CsbD family protein [Burkholderiales bacterium]